MEKNIIDTISFSGGGIRFLAYIGTLRVLEERDIIKNIKTISGTSSGSIFALLINLGYTSEEMLNMMNDYEFHNMSDISIDNLMEKYGFDKGKKIIQFIVNIIKKKYNGNITFKELYEKTDKHLIISATCLNKIKTEYFDYKNTPTMRIWHAIRLSISVPYYFTVEKYKSNSYIDGALLDNLPIKIFPPGDNVLGFMLTDNKTNDNITIDTFDSFTLSIFKCLRKKSEDFYDKYNIVNINTESVGTLDFEIEEEGKNKLFHYGYENTNNYFSLLEETNKEKVKKIKLKID